MSYSKTDLMYEIEYNPDFSPERSKKVNVKTMIVDDQPKYTMKNHSTGTYYDLDEISNSIWNLIDGKRSLQQITEEISAMWKDKDKLVDMDTVKEVVSFLAEANCLEAACEGVKKKRVRFISAFEIDVTLIENGEVWLKKISKAVRPFLKNPLLWIALAFIVVNSIAFSGKFVSIFFDAASFRILGSTVVGFFFYTFVVLAPAIVIHELAHAVTLIHYGGMPGEIGTGLFYFGPMFYVDATDSWMLPRRQRIMVMMAGNISTLLIASIIVTWGFILPFPSSISHILYMAAFFCFFTTLMNLAPPFETDGYYVLMDLLNIPTLRTDSYNYVKQVIRKALRRPVEKIEDLTARKRKIFVGFTILSVAWIIYTVYQTTLFTLYMAGDAMASFANISSAILFAQSLSFAAVVISIASVIYFAMTVTGYGVVMIAAVKKAVKKTLRFESIHDRDLSVFFYLPPAVPESIVQDLRKNVKEQAEKLTPNHTIRNLGHLQYVSLRMGGAELAMVQMKEYLRKTELIFYTMYWDFLQKHIREISNSICVNYPPKSSMTTLLKEMGSEIAASGLPGAKSGVNMTLDEEKKTILFLLNSVFGTVWTIELPPIQQQQFLDTLLPTFLAEDLAITGLYGEAEAFKKSTVYGFDTLAKLSSQSQRCLKQALLNPEENQVVAFLEPVKSRLVFVGRTEQMKQDVSAFGSLFVCQAWCGYLDNLLSETTLTLAALGKVPPVEKEDIQTLSKGELIVLQKNLSGIASTRKLVREALQKCETCLTHTVIKSKNLRENCSQSQILQSGLLDPTFEVNLENLKHLPLRFRVFREQLLKLYPQIEIIAAMTKREFEKRKLTIPDNKHKIFLTHSLVTILSVILVFAGLVLNTGLSSYAFIAGGIVLSALYWMTYLRWRSLHTVGKYPSPAFSHIQLSTLAFAQTVHKFLATSDILAPAEGKFSTRSCWLRQGRETDLDV